MTTVIRDGHNGFIDTDPGIAIPLGEQARAAPRWSAARKRNGTPPDSVLAALREN